MNHSQKQPTPEKTQKRSQCTHCKRPLALCLCSTCRWIENQVPVIILQHPTEVKKPFATYRIVENCLRDYALFVGEDFHSHHGLHRLLSRTEYQNYLVFPGDGDDALIVDIKTKVVDIKAKNVSKHTNESMLNAQLIFIDGTWRKAKKIFYANPFLHDLPKVGLVNVTNSEYAIRRSRVRDSLSLVEACYFTLSTLDRKNNYLPLMDTLRLMVKKQQAFTPR